jgi:ribosomal protein L37AE/L43A
MVCPNCGSPKTERLKFDYEVGGPCWKCSECGSKAL